MSKISRTKAIEVIENTKGRIFTAVAATKTEENRVFNVRLGVKSYAKGGKLKFNPKKLGMITVFDMKKKGYRTLNLQDLKSLNANKQSYTIQ